MARTATAVETVLAAIATCSCSSSMYKDVVHVR